MIVYADVLFAVNWVMDYFALFAAARVLGLAHKRVRLFLGAFIGAAYCVLKLFVPLAEPLAAIAVSLAMCAAALWNGKVLTYVKAVVLFYAASMLIGGVMTFVYERAYCLRHLPLFRDGLTPGMFFACVGVLFVLLFFCGRLLSQKTNVRCATVCVRVDDKSERFRLLCDSGNLLRDPYNGLPVMILDGKSLDKLFGKDGFHRHFDASETLAVKRKFRYIPVQTPGGEGILASFLPDEIRLCEKNGRKRCIAARIAVDLRDNPYGENDGILPLAAMNA